MKNWIAKKILEKEDVQFVFAVGGWGKSMVLSSIQMLEKVDKKSSIVLHSENPVSSEIVTHGGERGIIKGFLSSLGKDAIPDRICMELHQAGQMSEQIIPLLKDVTVVITTLPDEDKQDISSVKKYLEKILPVLKMNSKAVKVVANADIPNLLEALESYDLKKMVTFGLENPDADIKGMNIEFLLADTQSIDSRLRGMSCKVQHFGSTVPLQITGGIGLPHLMAKLGALGVAHTLGVSAVELLGFLRQEPILPGHMTLIPGIKKSLIIDDSYEMSFETAQIALQDASKIAIEEGQKRIAVLGSMLHDGRYTDQHHCLLGKQLFEAQYDLVVAVGEKGHDILQCAEQAGMQPHQLRHFESKVEAGKFVQHELRMGDIILIKGNKEEQFETVVKELMAFPLQAKEDLVQR